jgi:hypothetical protein
MENHQLINQTSADTEWYTAPTILNAARLFLNGIDLDPASSEVANKHVQAKTFYGYKDGEFTDGLFQTWRGKIWLNHPFGRAEEACGEVCVKHLASPSHRHHTIPFHGNAAWITKLNDEVLTDNVTEALCITYACTSEAWFQPLLKHPQCFLSPRTNYYLPDGTIKRGVTKGSVITYFGDRAFDFVTAFRGMGMIKVLYK